MKFFFSTPYHPQSNIVGRGHRTLNAYLRAFRDNWTELLKYATFVYSNTEHSTTGHTPHSWISDKNSHHLTKEKLSYNYDNLADYTRNNIAKAGS